MTNSIGEIEFNDVLFIIGSNAPEAHPIIGNKMKRAGTMRGAKLIVVDPRRTELAEYAHLWLRLKPGTDNALVNGLLHLIISNGWHDTGLHRRALRGVRRPLGGRAGVPARASQRDHRRARRAAAARPPSSTRARRKAGIFYTLGITEHTTGTANVMNLANLAMVTGHIGVEYAGVNPLRGQNNVQGSCDMGALPNSPAGLPEGQRRAGIGQVSSRPGACPCPRRWACASPRCSTWPSTASSRRCTSWARTRCSPTPTPTTCARRWAASSSWSPRTSS